MSDPQFEQLLAQLLSTDNAIRGHAEATFNEVKKNSENLAISLIKSFRLSPVLEHRSLCLVMAKRLISKENMFANLSEHTRAFMKNELLAALEAEQVNTVRSKVADCISDVAIFIFDKLQSQWPELLPFMLKCTKSENPLLREAAFQIFADLAFDLREQMAAHFGVLKEVLTHGLSDKEVPVRIATLAATCNFLQVLTEPTERGHFQQLTPLMLETISAALNAEKEEEAQNALQLFIDLAEQEPIFLRPNLELIVNAMLVVATASQLEDATRHLGIEFLVTLAESKPTMARKHPNFIQRLLPVILNLLLDLDDDDEEWEKEEKEDDVEITNYDVGQEELNRLSLAVQGKALVPILFSVIPQLLSNPDWKHRYVGIMSISIIGEGSNKFLAPNLPEIVNKILPYFKDANKRVRYACCHAAGQMSTDFGPDFQTAFHSQIVPALIGAMDDPSPRTASHAAAAIINFCESIGPEVIKPYLDPLLAKLFTLLQNPNFMVQEQTLTAIAGVADCCKEDFIPYYDTFLPYMKTILATATSKEMRLLRGKTIECISLIGGAVGKEKFYPDAKAVMELLAHAQSQPMEPDDPQVSYMLQAWARICKCLGNDFIPYLPFVMPPLMATAQIKPNISVLGEDDEDTEGWDFVSVGDKRIGINTSALEDKYTACDMIFCYVTELGEGFFPYVEPVSKILVPLMRFNHHEGVRSSAACTMAPLLSCAAKYLSLNAAPGADSLYVRKLFDFMFPTFIEAIKEETIAEILVQILECFIDCFDIVGEQPLTQEQIDSVTEVLGMLFLGVKERREERDEQKKEPDHDEEEEERIDEEELSDEEILSEVGDIIGRLIRFSKQGFFPRFNMLLEPVLALLGSQNETDVQTAICVFDDLVEFGLPESAGFLGHFLPIVLPAISSSDPSIRQAAAYGAGVCAEKFPPPQFAPIANEIVHRLMTVITSAEAQSEEFINPTENAICAFGKVCRFQADSIDSAKAIPMWLSWLPVKSDHLESPSTYKILCDLVESSNPHLLGDGLKNMPTILKIFAFIVGTDWVDEEGTQRIANIIKKIPQDALQKWGAVLSPEEQQRIHAALTM